MRQKNSIIIVGGGLNGAMLALALAQAGFAVTLVDSRVLQETRQNDPFDGRAYALALTSQRLLLSLGLWEHVSKHAQPILHIKVTDGQVGEQPSPFWLHFDHAEIEEGPVGFMVEDRHLRHALLKFVNQNDRITFVTGTTVISQEISANIVSIQLDNGESLGGQLLIGCDGSDSLTAKRAKIAHVGRIYGQTSLVCALDHKLPHRGVAHQLFLPAGPLAILPLTGNSSSIVWTETNSEAAKIHHSDDSAYLAALRLRLGKFLGEIDLRGSRHQYSLSLRIAEKFVAERVALVGDAAHCIHPIAGQGLNAGIRDVGALAEVLATAARRGEDVGSSAVLRRYQQWRRFDCLRLAIATDAFNRLFSNDIPILRTARDLGLGIVNAIPELRRTFMREASGLRGTVPRLLQGKQI
ncbi:MAG: FAD-dependent monooxygenase [Aestuariivita sp.]|nr:FAD-dependent monooxygenase [Aestuariivita sp.]MCY4346098.1 FAD-dependent monooxygenase [Aestuariivita sp.]